MANLGVNSDTQFDYPKNGKLTLPSLSLEGQNPQLPLQISLTGLEINYDWYKLISLQRLISIDIDSLEITIKPLAQSTSKTASTFMLADALPEKWFKQLPLEHLTIKHFSIKAATKHLANKLPLLDTMDTLLDFNGKLTIDNESLALKGQYFEDDLLVASTDLQVTNNNAFNISSTIINTNDKQHPIEHQITGRISQDTKGLALATTQNIVLDNFNTPSIWARAFLNDEIKTHIESITAKATLSHALSFSQPDDNSLHLSQMENQFEIQGEISNPDQFINSSPLQIASGKISIKGALAKTDNELHFSILPNSDITLTKLHNKDISADKINAEIIEAVSLSCQLPCDTVKSLQTNASSLPIIKLNLAATDWTSPFGKASHQPLTLKVTTLDLLEPAFSIDYQNLSVDFSATNKPPASKNSLPFSKLSLLSNGELTWKDQQLAINTTLPLSIEASKVRVAGNSTEQLKLTIKKGLELKIVPNKQSLMLKQADISIAKNTWQTEAGALNHAGIKLQLKDFNLLQQQGVLHVKSPSITLKAKKLPFNTLQTHLALNAALKDKTLTLTIDKNLRAKLSKFSLDSLSASKLRIDSKRAIKIKLPIDLKEPQLNLEHIATSAIVSPMRFTLSSKALKVDQQKMRFKYATLALHSIKLAPFKAHASSTIKSFQSSFPKLDNTLQMFDIKASHWLNKTRYDGKVSIENPTLALKAKADIKATKSFKNLEANWRVMPFALNALSIDRLRKLTDQWPAQLQIIDGQYSNKGSFVKRGNKLSAKITHQIKDANLLRDKLLTSGINLQSQTQFIDNKLSQSGKLTITNINSPVPISAISTEFALRDLLTDKPKLSLRRLGADLLGTRIKVKQLAAQLTPLSTRGSIEFTQLPLNNILKLENQPSLSGEGLLEGKLPFRLQDKNLWIDKGRINSMGSGVIRYQMNEKIRALASSNQGLAIAANVLENFKYQSLDITANYSPDGKLLLANRLKGQNPDWQNGQPIDFSINIEENILKLLKTLQFTDELEEKLQKKVQGKISQ